MTDARMGTAGARFVALNTHLQGRAFAMFGPSAIIGRSADCEIFIDLASVSRQHARVEEQAGVFRVLDLGSRNGIRVRDEQVRETVLNDGDVLAIGDIQLRFESVAQPEIAAEGAGPAARPLTGKDVVSVVQSQQGLGAGEGMTIPEEAQTTAPSAGLNLKMIAAIILALLLSLGIGVLILRGLAGRPQTRQAEMSPVLVKVGEKKWLRIAGVQSVDGGARQVQLGDFSGIDAADTSVATAEKYDPGELLITGEGGGETTVTLAMDSGAVITIRVLVRGRIEDPLESLTYGAYTDEERAAEAQQFLRDGMMIESEKPYLALQEYQKAEAVLKPLRERGQLYLQIKQRLAQAERTVDERWSKLRGDILVAIRNNDRPRQFQLLEEALKLLSDPNDPRRQKVEWRRRELVQQEIMEKERRGSK